MTKETYEIVIETLANELEMERWRRKETEKELEAVRKENAKMINELKGEKENA
jgi:ketol-acid reductoisomerase